jgi:SagB-type dehydrogenase family enzyme
MSTLTKIGLGMVGLLKPRPAVGQSVKTILLPAPTIDEGISVMQALKKRRSGREFSPAALSRQVLSNLLWAAFGINREESGGRTAPSARNAQEIDVYAALPEGLYRYDPAKHTLIMELPRDIRHLTGMQEFVDEAPVNLVYVADRARMKGGTQDRGEAMARIGAGAIAENVYLFCASAGLAAVARALIDHTTLSRAMKLGPDQIIMLTQTIGYPVA